MNEQEQLDLLFKQHKRKQEIWDKLDAKHERMLRNHRRWLIVPVTLLVIWAVGTIALKAGLLT